MCTHICMNVHLVHKAVLTHVVSLCQFLPSVRDTQVPKCAPSAYILQFSCASFVDSDVSIVRKKAALTDIRTYVCTVLSALHYISSPYLRMHTCMYVCTYTQRTDTV